MKDVLVTWKDVAFLLGESEKDAKAIFESSIPEGFNADRILKKKSVITRYNLTCHIKLPASSIKSTFNSPSEALHGKNRMEYVISQLRLNGIPDSMKRDILTNETCILKGRICGKFNPLNKVLTTKQRMDIGEALKRQKISLLSSGNKTNKKIIYSLSEDEDIEIEKRKNPLFID